MTTTSFKWGWGKYEINLLAELDTKIKIKEKNFTRAEGDDEKSQEYLNFFHNFIVETV